MRSTLSSFTVAICLIAVRAFASPDCLLLLKGHQANAGLSFGTPSAAATGPFNHSWIETFTALGDSYSVGLGAGHAITAVDGIELNSDCYQYSYGFPYLMNTNCMIGANPNRTFQYLGCSGALANNVTSLQVPKMQQSQLVTLSAGGNDARLSTILNHCIFQWALFGGDDRCDLEIASANMTINSAQYTNDLENLMAAVIPKLAGSEARIYWVGYERFWDDSTDDCDNVTWSFSIAPEKQYLTQDRRTEMNSLVDNVNAKIQTVCQASSQCVFVDLASDIDTLKGHMCEPGVDESYHWIGGGASANREQTWFYEWGTTKDDDKHKNVFISQPQKRESPAGISTSTTLSSFTMEDGVSFEYAIAYYIQQGQLNGSLNSTAMGAFPIERNFSGTALWVPDYIGRVFHRDKYANVNVALRVLDAMDVEATQMGQPTYHHH